MVIWRVARDVALGIGLLLACTAPRPEPTRGVTPPPTGAVLSTPAAAPTTPPAELSAAPTAPALELSAAPAPTPEGPLLVAPAPLTGETAVEQVVERAPLPPEARVLARTLRPTLTAEHDGASHWLVYAGTLGQWRVHDTTWEVEPADGVAELWALQSRLDLR